MGVKNRDEVNSKVQHIVDEVRSSGCLGKTQRQCDLLKYLLNEKEQGRLSKITPFSVAVDVLERGDDFDSATDSIVRVEMHRLRNNLKQFNAGSKNLHLEIPRASYEVVTAGSAKTKNKKNSPLGSYYKQLALTSGALIAVIATILTPPLNKPAVVTASNCSSILPNISVKNSGNLSDLQMYVGKIIRSSVSQYTSVKLVDAEQTCGDVGTPHFTIDYMVVETNGAYHVAMTTYNEMPSRIVKQSDVGGAADQPHDQNDIFYDLVTSIDELVKPYGAIPKYAITKAWDKLPYRDNYRCLIVMYDSFSGESDQEYMEALSCLQMSAKTGVASLDNLGGLAASYLEQVQGYRDKTIDDPLLEASNIIDGVGDSWINSVEMTIAKMMFEVERPDFNSQRLKTILSESESRYKSHPQVLLMVAIYSGYKLGDWEHAKYLSDRVKRIHAERDNSVFVIDAAYSLLYETADTTMKTCKKVYSENSLIANLIVHACARQSQDELWIEKTQSNLNRLEHASTALQVNFIQNKELETAFSERIIQALQLPPV